MGRTKYSHLLVATITIPHFEKGYRVAKHLVEKVVHVEEL